MLGNKLQIWLLPQVRSLLCYILEETQHSDCCYKADKYLSVVLNLEGQAVEGAVHWSEILSFSCSTLEIGWSFVKRHREISWAQRCMKTTGHPYLVYFFQSLYKEIFYLVSKFNIPTLSWKFHIFLMFLYEPTWEINTEILCLMLEYSGM